jgi:hypothetical protein
MACPHNGYEGLRSAQIKYEQGFEVRQLTRGLLPGLVGRMVGYWAICLREGCFWGLGKLKETRSNPRTVCWVAPMPCCGFN